MRREPPPSSKFNVQSSKLKPELHAAGTPTKFKVQCSKFKVEAGTPCGGNPHQVQSSKFKAEAGTPCGGNILALNLIYKRAGRQSRNQNSETTDFTFELRIGN
jgi:hypothetical protein